MRLNFLLVGIVIGVIVWGPSGHTWKACLTRSAIVLPVALIVAGYSDYRLRKQSDKEPAKTQPSLYGDPTKHQGPPIKVKVERRESTD